jgi:hypothetical protein
MFIYCTEKNNNLYLDLYLLHKEQPTDIKFKLSMYNFTN